MPHPHEWCRTLGRNGTTLLLMRGWNDEEERPMMAATLQIDHIIAGDTDFCQTTFTHMKNDEDAPLVNLQEARLTPRVPGAP